MNIGRKACSALSAGILVFLLAASASAAELRFIEVDRENGRYSLKSTTWFDAKIEAVYSVLIDYDLYHRFSGAIAESRNLDPNTEGQPEYYTRMEGCVLIWCQSFERVGYLRLEPLVRIEAISDPDRSDFLFARESWELRKHANILYCFFNFL